jgi:hypothetical protein
MVSSPIYIEGIYKKCNPVPKTQLTIKKSLELFLLYVGEGGRGAELRSYNLCLDNELKNLRKFTHKVHPFLSNGIKIGPFLQLKILVLLYYTG